MDVTNRLDRAFFERPTDQVAAELIGCTLTTFKDDRLTGGRIVETEAYGGPTDLASHAAIYRRSRAEIMGGPSGIAYVYRSYGVHACFNIVASRPGSAGAVLIRALEPVQGIEVMVERRCLEHLELLCAGPGRLTQALAIKLEDNGIDVVVEDSISLMANYQPRKVVATTRIGITRDVDRLWRFCDADSPFLSRPVRGSSVMGIADASMKP